ncbi:IS21-like element helper ATPase IstB [Ramlibacter sp.]|uniref:IS21-like element helper ATPase IstB n=1 Tax=Ramlibacter sp. TaxID=1917967 RepID=UPI0017DF2642|nr:IS21-like element helper ATPase IstB [Ramlibacter sp.]MBA2672828.1 ATP-binding protein [Ramlibacter sp.]MBA3683906.1 ATP-binding protein [Planctomycetota bacterium]
MTAAPAPSTTHTTAQALKALRLPSMARSWHELASDATEHAWSHERFLGALCELELTERTNRRLASRLMAAKLPPGKRLDSFEFGLVPGLSRARVEALGAGDWIRAAGNCLLFGGSGTGKSHIAAAIGYALIEAGHSVLFVRTTDLVQRLQAARRDLALPALLAKLDRIDCLILDDLGYVRKDQSETSILFELIAERYEHRSLIITCDRPFADWASIFTDQIMTVAAIDRLVHHATILEFGCESYRKRTAGQRVNALTPPVVTAPGMAVQNTVAHQPRPSGRRSAASTRATDVAG